MSLYQQGQSPVDSNRRDATSYESTRPAWDSRQSGYPSQPSQHWFQPQPRPESRSDPPPNFWDEEGSDSDVSRTRDPREPVNRIISPIAAPRQLPPISSPRTLTALDDVQIRLDELERIEDHNAQKLKRLESKRRRKDERILRRRAMEDEKIRLVHDARARKDERIRNRRLREDEAFRSADKQLGVEELDLRRRLRSLKRGLPIEEGRQDGGSASAASMSPPLPQSHGGPPPPKRHQSGPPGQNESPVPPSVQPSQHSPASQYHFYQPLPPHSAYPVPYHHAPPTTYGTYHAPPTAMHPSAPAGSALSPHPSNPRTDIATPKTNGFNSTPSPVVSGSVPPPSGPIDTRPPPPGPPTYAVPTYDTRPPPPTTGFTSVNAGQPQPSGFATVNARGPTYATSPPPKPPKERGTPKSEGHRRTSGKSPKNTTPITVGGLTLNKRTPSTTHPYQMSEAFANRHHHCERTDELGRGIWTSYGYMGSQEVPTGPAVEMYLRCNHDDCKRIDWRTVHGLQCHIVKNHGQPKGTIGSLEKALAIYGLPVSEVSEIEKIHGLGSAGQMADPKNQKIKIKTREAMQKSESPASGDMSTPTLTPSASNTSNVTPLGGPLFPQTLSRAASSEHKGMVTDLGPLKNVADWSGRQNAASEAPIRPNNNFVAVRNTWSTYVPPAAPARNMDNNSPLPSVDPIPAPSLQQDSPAAVQDRTQLAPSEPSDVKLAPITATEVSNPDSAAGLASQAAVEVTPLPNTRIETFTSTVEPKDPALNTTSQVEAQIPKEEPETTQNAAIIVSAPPQVDKIVVPEKSEVEDKPSEPQPSTQVAEVPQQPPTTPGRRPSRRESLTISKSAQKDSEATSMQSPKISKAENKRSGRRASVAVSTASVSANASVDGDGDKSGEDAEKESAKTTGSRRHATGRFLRKVR